MSPQALLGYTLCAVGGIKPSEGFDHFHPCKSTPRKYHLFETALTHCLLRHSFCNRCFDTLLTHIVCLQPKLLLFRHSCMLYYVIGGYSPSKPQQVMHLHKRLHNCFCVCLCAHAGGKILAPKTRELIIHHSFRRLNIACWLPAWSWKSSVTRDIGCKWDDVTKNTIVIHADFLFLILQPNLCIPYVCMKQCAHRLARSICLACLHVTCYCLSSILMNLNYLSEHWWFFCFLTFVATL